MYRKQFINSIRQDYCGLQDRPRKALASSIQTLANDLYSKDSHFIFELIQNAEDNSYKEKEPELRFEVTREEIGGYFNNVLKVHNNETGFEEKNIDALCHVGHSTKNKAQGYIGEKGIGFKSVFKYTSCPYVFSNGFNFCLPDQDEETGLGYIVPKWVDEMPKSAKSQETTIILPLDRAGKDVLSVAEALRDIAPETLLFLQKLRRISVAVKGMQDLPEYEVIIEKKTRLVKGDSRLEDITYIKKIGDEEELFQSHSFWVTEIEYKKPEDVYHEKREGIDNRKVSVALSLTTREPKGKLFAYLPVWEDTKLPFLINADFLLVSSREGLREDEEWNWWLRDKVSETYVKALTTLLNEDTLSLKEKINSYASIPLVSNQSFLETVIEQIHDKLEEVECIFTLPNQHLKKPSTARLCSKEFRALIFSSKGFYELLDTQSIALKELEPYSEQFEAIGVSSFSLEEVINCLGNNNWLGIQANKWIIDLYRYLKNKNISKKTLITIPIIPVKFHNSEKAIMSCEAEQTGIYFNFKEKIPEWLYEHVPVAFISIHLMELLDKQNDAEDLKKWLTDKLHIYPFSLPNYCIDIGARVGQINIEVDKAFIIKATGYILEHSGESFEWDDYPFIIFDGSISYLQDGWELVTPRSYDDRLGWQHIWSNAEDQHDFYSLSDDYPLDIIDKLVKKKIIEKYPSPQKGNHNRTEYEKRCIASIANWTELGEVINYRPMECLTSNNVDKRTSTALEKWIEYINFNGIKYCTIEYIYYSPKIKRYDSELVVYLKKTAWLNTSKGIVSPEEAFLPSTSIKEALADTVPYYEGKLSNDVLEKLGVKSEVTNEALLNLLKSHSGKAVKRELIEIIFSQLNSRIRKKTEELSEAFLEQPLIPFFEGKEVVWKKSNECIWRDAKGIVEDELFCLEKHYPDYINLFVNCIGVKQNIDTEYYAERWLELQDNPLKDEDDQLRIVERILKELKSLGSVRPEEQPEWWAGFIRKAKIYTQSNKFADPDEIVIPDDGSLRKIFKDVVEFVFRPTKSTFTEWLPFYFCFDIPLLSECVKESLSDSIEYNPKGENIYLTVPAIKMLATWIKEKRSDDYHSLLKDGVFEKLFKIREVCSTSEVEVEFELETKSINVSKVESTFAFWDRQNDVLIYSNKADRRHIAKTLAKGIKKRDSNDLASYIENILESSDITRLIEVNWNVPREISDLSKKDSTISNVGLSISDKSNGTSKGKAAENGPPTEKSKSLEKDHGLKKETDISHDKVEKKIAINYKDELTKGFNKKGKTSFDDEHENADRVGSGVIKDPERRSKKVGETIRENISNEPAKSDRSRTTERKLLEPPNEEVRTSLKEWYGGKCQICKQTWPKRNGEPYFTAAYLVERHQAKWIDHPGNAICLCADHFAQWCHAAIEVEEDIVEQVVRLSLKSEGGDGKLSISFKMLDIEHSIEFVEKHLLALRELIKVNQV